MTLANKLNNFKKFLTILKKIEENCVVLFFFILMLQKKFQEETFTKLKTRKNVRQLNNISRNILERIKKQGPRE